MSLIAQKISSPDTKAAAYAESFRGFVSVANPRYQWYKHCEVIADVAERVASGELKRVMLFVPPRHSKSETISRLFTAYYLRRHPDRWVGLSSYSSELAYVLSRASQENYIASGGHLSAKAGAVKHWETGKGGGLWAAGVGGPITGKGFHVGIIDDPLKNSEEASSAVIREKQKEWYRSTFYTRAEPNAAIVVIQCMTGDTPVLMANGIEVPLRNIKVGDRIATYDKGKLAVSTVRNHASNGRDYVYKITTTSGIIVHANERHPFLVEEYGELKWLRLKYLNTAHKIVTLKGNGASGKERLALPTSAKNPPSVAAFATSIIKGRNGQTDTARRQLMQKPTAIDTLSIGTESASPSITQCWQTKTADAPFVDSHRELTCERIGAGNSVLTTATKLTRSEGFYATTAILPLDMPSQKQSRSLWPNTSDFTVDQIESIEPDGIEEVFDIQVDRTENFIANGLVSHNTRWHEDDLSGWLLSEEAGESPERWHIVNLPAIAESAPPFPESCTMEHDWRNKGEALCPERYSIERLNQVGSRIGGYYFSALYQQRPSTKEGAFFKVSNLQIIPTAPANLKTVRAWDLAASTKGDYTAGVKIGKDDAGLFYVLDVVRGQWLPDERNRVMAQTAAMDGRSTRIRLSQDPGQAGVDQVQALTRMLAGYNVKTERESGSKEARADGLAAQVNVGNVKLIEGAWKRDFIEEMRTFPLGKNDDQCDAAANGFNELAGLTETKIRSFRI